MSNYIWQQHDWPNPILEANLADLQALELEVKSEAEQLAGFLGALSTSSVQQTQASLLADEVTDTSAIEGVRLSRDSAYASALRRLGAAPQGKIDRRHLPVIEALLDATEHSDQPVTEQALHAWQTAVVAAQPQALLPPLTGMYRASTDEMQIVSYSPMGKERIHYIAPPAEQVAEEMTQLLKWINTTDHEPLQQPSFAKAALAHLWFEIIHPYEDGNGRVGRLLWDRLIARAANCHARLAGRWWAVSHHVARDPKPYYAALNAVSLGKAPASEFVEWGLQETIRAFRRTRRIARDVVRGQEILALSATAGLNLRQTQILGLMVKHGSEGFSQGMSVRKYRSLTEASEATASRDLSGLVKAGFLAPRGAGRSRVYDVVWATET